MDLAFCMCIVNTNHILLIAILVSIVVGLFLPDLLGNGLVGTVSIEPVDYNRNDPLAPSPRPRLRSRCRRASHRSRARSRRPCLRWRYRARHLARVRDPAGRGDRTAFNAVRTRQRPRARPHRLGRGRRLGGHRVPRRVPGGPRNHWPKPMIHRHLTSTERRTPLVQPSRMGLDRRPARVLAKLEMQHPGGRVNDRLAIALLDDA